MPGEVSLALHSTFTPPSSAIAGGLSLCRSQPDLSVLFREPGCPAPPKIDFQSKTFAVWVLCSGSFMSV